MRRRRRRLDRDPVNIFELDPSIRRIDSALRSADRPEFAQMMRDLKATKIADGSLARVADAATQEIDAEKARPGEARSRGRRILRGLGGMAARLIGFARVVREGRKVWSVGKAFFESEEWRAIEEALSKAQEKFAALLADALDPLDAPDKDDDPEP